MHNTLLLQQFDLLATAPGGVAKLRELILTLAVQGKLVPQDPADEPASELLKRIRAEKDRLIAEGKIKRDKLLAPIEGDEEPFALPVGWEWVRFDELIHPLKPIAYGVLVPGPDQDTGVPFVRIADLSLIDPPQYPEKTISPEVDAQFQRTRLGGGEILMGVVGSIGKLGIAPPTWAGANIARAICRIVPADTGLHDFVLLLLQARFMQDSFAGDTRTLAQPTLNIGLIRAALTPMPPPAEQARIVARVEELMRVCDALEATGQRQAVHHRQLVQTLLGDLTADSHTSWKRVAAHFDTLLDRPSAVDALEQTILQLAVRGQLVPQDPTDEPASELLKRIRAEKDRLIAAGKIKRDKPLAPVAEDEQPFALPLGWEWVRLGNAAKKITDGTHHSPANFPTGDFMYLSAKNIKSWGIDLSSATYVPRTVHDEIYARCDPELGDILYIKDGATTGVLTVNTLREPFSLLSSVGVIKPSCGLSSEYMALVMQSPFFYQAMRDGMSGVAITRVTLSKLADAKFPLPPLPEQARIVARVAHLRRLCADLRQRLATSQTTQAALAGALAANAISGVC